MTRQTGTLVGIARREAKFAPMDVLERADITLDHGVAQDSRGRRRANSANDRQVTVVSVAAWRAACAALGRDVPWTARRANLLVEGIALGQTRGARITIGAVELEITQEIDPCARMDAQHPGLTAALAADWRGGVGCRIVTPGSVRIGDHVSLIAPP